MNEFHKYNAFITRVVDGDTVDALVDLGFKVQMKTRFRLTGFDAPETYRPKSADEKNAGLKATAYLESLIGNRPVIIHSNKFGKYRYLATIYTVNGGHVNNEMIAAGHTKK